MKSIALYARVSSEAQEKQATVASQIAVLVERAKSDGHVVLSTDIYVDDGYSGSTMVRPALEKLRDRVAEGGLELLYVHSPDRLARRYAYQVVLLEEFSRGGVSVSFLNGTMGATAEDQLLVQVQGVIAEYERAKILERSRRGKLHKAKSGSINPLSGAPYGYQYVRKTPVEPARYQVLLHEAKVVRQVFGWFLEEQVSMLAITRRLTAEQIPTRTGRQQWGTTAVWNLLRNPAYAGRAAYGKTEQTAKSVMLRPPRGRSGMSRREKSSAKRKPSSEWLFIPVPAIVSEEVFAAAQDQLKRNVRLSPRNCGAGRYLLQGLTVCVRCGFASYGRRFSYRLKSGEHRHYCCVARPNVSGRPSRCTGAVRSFAPGEVRVAPPSRVCRVGLTADTRPLGRDDCRRSSRARDEAAWSSKELDGGSTSHPFELTALGFRGEGGGGPGRPEGRGRQHARRSRRPKQGPPRGRCWERVRRECAGGG